MVTPVGRIRVEGLREFNAAVKQVDSELPKAVRIALNEAAGVIVDYARPRVPRRSGRAAGSIRVASTRTAVRVREGSAKAPYMPWLDFGGKVGPQASVARPFIRSGRYIWRALEVKRDDVLERMSTALAEVARKAGLDIHE